MGCVPDMALLCHWGLSGTARFLPLVVASLVLLSAAFQVHIGGSHLYDSSSEWGLLSEGMGCWESCWPTTASAWGKDSLTLSPAYWVPSGGERGRISLSSLLHSFGQRKESSRLLTNFQLLQEVESSCWGCDWPTRKVQIGKGSLTLLLAAELL